MKKTQSTIFYLFTLVLIFFSFLTALILFTNWGLRYSLQHSNLFLHGRLKYSSATGYLGSHFVLNDVEYTDQAVDVRIKRLELNWVPLYAFRKRYFIKSLKLNNVKFHIQKNDNPPIPFSERLKIWFDRIILQYLEINDLTIFYTDTPYRLPHIQVKLNPKNEHEFFIGLPQGKIEGVLRANHRPDWKWALAAKGTNVDSNDIWRDSHAILNFDFTSEGEWGKNKRYFTFSMPQITGTVRGAPLTGSILISQNDNQLFIDNINLSFGKNLLFIKGRALQHWDLVWRIFIPDLNNINSKLRGTIQSNGTVKTIQNLPFIAGNITGQNIKIHKYSISSLEGRVSSNIKDKRLFFILNGHQVKLGTYLIPLLRMNWDAVLTPSRIYHRFIAYFSERNIVKGILTTSNVLNSNPGEIVNGKLELQFLDLSKVITSKLIHYFKGYVEGQFNVVGPFKKPRVTGFLELKQSSFIIPDLGIHPQISQFRADFQNNLIGKITGQVASGPGSVDLNGELDLTQPLYPIKVFIRGENFQILNTKEYKITASPDIYFTMEAEQASVQGRVLLPFVRIIAEEYSKIVKLPPELEFAHEKKSVRYFKNLALRFLLEIGDNAYIAYQNLRAHIGGQVQIFQVPGGLPSGNGSLWIKQGYYRVYDRMFAIDEGRLIYAGNLITNPGLSIRAMRTTGFPQKNFLGYSMASDTDKMQIGVSVTGTLQEPITELVSRPVMSQDDILSYLVFGQPRGNIGALDALSLLGTVTSQLNINEPTAGDSVTTGGGFSGFFKMGIFNPIEAFNFSIPIGLHWKIRTETSLTETGIDLLYDYEIQ